MNKMIAIALAATFGAVGVAETAPQANAAETLGAARSVSEVRANALAEMNAGDLQQVRDRKFRSRSAWRGGRSYRGRVYFGPRRAYGRRYYGPKRYYGRRNRPGFFIGIR